jgi:hypothetical protein
MLVIYLESHNYSNIFTSLILAFNQKNSKSYTFGCKNDICRGLGGGGMLTSVCGVLRVSCRGYATKKSRWNIFGGGAKNADMYEVI